jgi:hypothetical protein
LQRSTALLESVTGMQLAVRLGLQSSDGQWLVVQYLTAGTAAAAAAEDETGEAAAPFAPRHRVSISIVSACRDIVCMTCPCRRYGSDGQWRVVQNLTAGTAAAAATAAAEDETYVAAVLLQMLQCISACWDTDVRDKKIQHSTSPVHQMIHERITNDATQTSTGLPLSVNSIAACGPAAAAAAAMASELQQVKLSASDSIFNEAVAAQAPRLVADTKLYSKVRLFTLVVQWCA